MSAWILAPFAFAALFALFGLFALLTRPGHGCDSTCERGPSCAGCPFAPNRPSGPGD